jgi:hypothetical protein
MSSIGGAARTFVTPKIENSIKKAKAPSVILLNFLIFCLNTKFVLLSKKQIGIKRIKEYFFPIKLWKRITNK